MRHLSYSQIAMYERCGLQWWHRYGPPQLKVPPGVALLVGSATHKAVEADLRAKLDTGALLEAGAVEAAARDALAARWADEPPVLDEDERDLGAAWIRGNATDEAVALARVHHRDVAPGIEPIHVEREITVGVPEIGYDLVGHIDVQTVRAIHDTKTAARAKGTADGRTPQLGLYRALLKAADGTAPSLGVLDVLIKGKVAKAQRLEVDLTDADAQAALDRVATVARGIQAGVFLPADPTSWVCTPKFCGYWQTCSQGARKAVSVALIDPASLVRRDATAIRAALPGIVERLVQGTCADRHGDRATVRAEADRLAAELRRKP